MSKHFVYVENDQTLKNLIRNLQSADQVAVDTEADSLHHYFEKVCLIQLSFSGEDYVVDPLSDVSVSKLMDALSKKTILLHGADFDLRMLKASFGFRPQKPIFDTMIAAQLLGFEKFSLAALVEKVCDVKLSKEGQKSNWSRRPLTEKQLFYARDDTRYLARVARELLKQLKTLDRLSWHEEACERVVQVTAKSQERDQDSVWRVKGAGVLDRRTLVYLKEIWHWRDTEARKSDRPAFMIADAQLLIQLAKWFASNKNATLVKGPKLPKNCVGKRLDSLERAVKKARSIPESKWPEKQKGRRFERLEDKKLIDRLRDECRRIAKGLRIEPSFLAPRSALRAIAMTHPQNAEKMIKVSGLMRWQVQLLFPGIQKVLESSPSSDEKVKS